MSKKLENICTNRCKSLCCFNGIDLSEEEAQKIDIFVKKNPELFPGLPEKHFEIGQLEHKSGEKGLRFALKKHQFFPPEIEIPDRFNNTICVFCNDNGYCMLHVAALKLDIPVEDIKPLECRIFPMMSHEGELLAPVTEDNKIREYEGKDYPTELFLFAPCIRYKPKDMTWEEYVGMNENKQKELIGKC